MSLYLTGDEAADNLLSTDPLALLMGMVLDQQVPLEKAFRSPFDLKERLGGTLDAATLASMDPEALAEVFSARPALHRFPKSMAGRVQEVCSLIVDSYGGDAAAVWTSAADGKQLLANVKALPGFGEQKAADLRRPARASSSASVPRVGAGGGTVRRDRLVPLGRRHRLTRGPDQGAPVQAADESQGQGQGVEARLTAPDGAGAGDWALASRRLYLCAPDRPDLERLHRAVHPGRRRRRAAPREAAPRCRAGRAGRPGPAGLRRPSGPVHPQRPPRPGRRHRGRRRPRRPGGHGSRRGPPVDGRRTPHRAVDPRPGRPRAGACAGRRSTTSRPARSTPTPDQARPARHRLGYVGEAVRSAPWPVWVTGGVDPDLGRRHGRRPAPATSWWSGGSPRRPTRGTGPGVSAG